MSDRYADDIRRIVGIDPNESFLDEAPVKSSIDGKRGIGYVNLSTGGTQSRSGTPGTTTLPTDLGDGNSDTGENQAGETGINPNDPQTAVTSSTTGVFSATDIIDGLASSTKTSSPQVGPAGLEYSNDGAISTITAEDCTSGQTIKIHTRNDFPPPEAVVDDEGTVLYNEWEDAETPPATAGFVEGMYWRGADGSDFYTTDSLSELITVGLEFLNTVTFASSNSSASYFKSTTYTLGELSGLTYQANTGSPLFQDFNAGLFVFGELICPSPPEDQYPGFNRATCPSTPPTDTQWPADEQYDLRLENGQLTTNPFDSEVPAEYKDPVSFVPFCFDGGRTGAFEVTKDNGFMIYETSGGAPTGIIRIYDSSGHMVAATDGTGSILDQYRPSPA